MHTLINFQFIVMLGFLVFFADVAIHTGFARDVNGKHSGEPIKALCYGLVALLALIFCIIALLGAS